MAVSTDLENVASWIRDARLIVVLTGAGISTESGIPDFRIRDHALRVRAGVTLASGARLPAPPPGVTRRGAPSHPPTR